MNKFLVSLNKWLQHNNPNFYFLQKMYKFLLRYDLSGRLDHTLLSKKLQTLSNKIPYHANDVTEVLTGLLPLSENEIFWPFVTAIEKAIIDSDTDFLANLSEESLVKFFYSYMIFSKKMLFKSYQHRSSKLESLIEAEIIDRSDKFTKKDLIKSLKLYELCQIINYRKDTLFDTLESCLIKFVPEMNEIEVGIAAHYLRFASSISRKSAFKFEELVIKNVSKYRLNTLYRLLLLVTSPKFTTTTDIVSQLQIEIMKKSQNKDLKAWLKHSYKAPIGNAKDNIFTRIFQLEGLNQSEKCNTYLRDTPTVMGSELNDRNLRSSLQNSIVGDILKLNDRNELLKIITLCSALNIQDATILDALFARVSKAAESFDLTIRQLSSIFYSFTNLGYFMDETVCKALIAQFDEKIHSRIKDIDVQQCYETIKSLCDNENIFDEEEKTQKHINVLKNKILKENYSFSASDQENLISYMSYSKRVYNQELVDYLLSSYQKKENTKLSFDRSIPNPRKLYIPLYKIQKLGGTVELTDPNLKEIYELGRVEEAKEVKEGLKAPQHKQILDILCNPSKIGGNLKVLQNAQVECYQVDFAVTNNETNTTVLIGICGKEQSYINKPNCLRAESKSKEALFKEQGHRYLTISADEWEKAVDKEKYLTNQLKALQIIN